MKLKSRIKNKCIHDKRKDYCKLCGGGSLCLHNKVQYTCKECNGLGICIHNKLKAQCVDCGGSKICQHNIRRDNCKLCKNPIDITIKSMIIHSKSTDKKLNIYDELNFVDYDYLKNLILESNDRCCYCSCELQYTYYNHSLATIERLNNNIGHIKSNCAIACKNCNLTKVGSNINPQI